MNHRSLLRSSARRRLVDLRIQPLLQLRLPVLLLALTGGFLILFAAHTRSAYGSLLALGFEDPGLRMLASEVHDDYLVVSAAIGAAYVVFVLLICLAGAHRFLGPIVALERHLRRLQRGDFASRVQLRSGHPLSGIAAHLNGLAENLHRSSPDAFPFSHEPAAPSLEGTSHPAPGESLVASTEADRARDAASSPWLGWYPASSSQA